MTNIFEERQNNKHTFEIKRKKDRKKERRKIMYANKNKNKNI